MERSDVVNLIAVTYTSDSIGQQIAVETKKPVYCRVRSSSQSEWFQGAQNGLKPAYEITMFKYDYDGENIVEYNGKRYGVYRTYESKNEDISVYVEDKAGV